jgi:membrane peptidoglycan carboxypeptidase
VDTSGKELAGQKSDCHQAIDPEIAATAAYALAGVVNGGTGNASNPHDGVPLIGKTGTTDQALQTWIVTSTTKVATAIWVGNSIGKVSLRKYRWAGMLGSQLRHVMMKANLLVINAKYGGGAFPPPADALLSGSGIAVPDVRGLTPEAAKQLLDGLGFEYADGGPIDSEIAAGRVAGTDPAAGSQSGSGAVITVYTSKGNLVTFPDVVGDGTTYTSAQAHSTLAGAGYSSVSDTCSVISSPTLPSDSRDGKVSASNPAPGSHVVPGAAVTLTITKLVCP